jgi:hypothetical protein
MFRYFARFEEKYDLPVYPIALFSYDAPLRPEPNEYAVVFPNKTVLSFSFDVIQLNRYDWHDYINTLNPVASALMAKMKIARQDRPKVKAECLRLLVKLNLDPARTQMVSGFVDTYLRLEAAEQKIFAQAVAEFMPAEKEQTLKIVTSWMEEGIEKGLQQGEEKIVLKLLRRRCGLLPETTEARIHGLDVLQLEELAEALLDFESIADVETWLDQNTIGKPE